jgi:hypothetical protein
MNEENIEEEVAKEEQKLKEEKEKERENKPTSESKPVEHKEEKLFIPVEKGASEDEEE